MKKILTIIFLLGGIIFGYSQIKILSSEVSIISNAGEGDHYITTDTDELYVGIQTGELRKITGESGPQGPAGPAGADGTSPKIEFKKETIGYVFAAAQVQANGDNSFNINCKVSKTETGRFTVEFGVKHPNGANYDITFGAQVEDANNRRDSRIVSVVAGTQTAKGFDVIILTGDNGTTADVLVDEVWSFNTSATKEIITDIQVTETNNPPVTVGVTPIGTIDGSTLVLDDFGDANDFHMQFRNSKGASIDYEVLISNTPYSTIPNISSGSYTLNSADNGDGTYNHLITSTSSLGPYSSVTVNGNKPSPAGTNYNKSNIAPITITFYTR
ncbi:hypothetical protein [Lutibacter citreus]|uniref:hypothetical protein n=1 Tax=Lutibacter citreus TaxID=2138210 RepID=UPI000DBEA726|nr:hypothetical protein [Lutibacter citreus]